MSCMFNYLIDTYLRFFLVVGGETILPVATASSSKCIVGCIIIEFTLCVVPSPKEKITT